MLPKQREMYAVLYGGPENWCAEQNSSQSKADNAVVGMVFLNVSTF